MKRISILGLGFVGLSTAVYLALRGYDVIASSNERRKAQLVRKGIPPFFEPELESMLRKALQSQKFRVIVGRTKAVLETDITFVTVGTPSLPDGSADLRFIKDTAKEIGCALKEKKGYHLVVVRSTVPPGTCENVVKPILEKYSGKKAGEEFGLAMNPEFLKEGAALLDIANPDRVLIGEHDKKAGSFLAELYEELHGSSVPILRTSLASAELAKYAGNAFLANKISFINQIASLCEKIPGVDVVEIARAIGLDPRIGPDFLRAGAGWGGSCLPKDTHALAAFSRKLGCEPKLLDEVISINASQGEHMVELAEEELGSLKGKKVAVLGLSFKPDTDDIREAPSMRVISLLLPKGAKVAVFDPLAIGNARKMLGGKIVYSRTVSECLKNADCCLLLTEWSVFKKLRPHDFADLMRTPLLIDGRRIFNAQAFLRKLRFRAIGLSKVQSEVHD